MKKISNMSATSCYCGQKGNDLLNMLECIKCRRWFHESCIKCLDLPILIGDRFYIFVCSFCNAGSECLGRIELKWQEITHLLLYNLTVLEKKKYFHLDEKLVPYLQDNWERFHIVGPVAAEKRDIRLKLLQVLKSNHDRYKCGKEVKKCKNNWALREKVPPDPPHVLPSAARLQKDVVVWDFQVRDRAYQIISVQKSRKNKEDTKNAKSKSKLHSTSTARQKNGEVSKCLGTVSHNENGILKLKHTNKCTNVSFNENAARSGLLDSLIPLIPNFNPFETSLNSCTVKCSSNEKHGSAPQRGRKRRQNIEHSHNDLSITNVNTKLSDENSSNEFMFMSTKDIMLQISKGDISIMGKRKTSTGNVQYLIERNR